MILLHNINYVIFQKEVGKVEPTEKVIQLMAFLLY